MSIQVFESFLSMIILILWNKIACRPTSTWPIEHLLNSIVLNAHSVKCGHHVVHIYFGLPNILSYSAHSRKRVFKSTLIIGVFISSSYSVRLCIIEVPGVIRCVNI